MQPERMWRRRGGGSASIGQVLGGEGVKEVCVGVGKLKCGVAWPELEGNSAATEAEGRLGRRPTLGGRRRGTRMGEAKLGTCLLAA